MPRSDSLHTAGHAGFTAPQPAETQCEAAGNSPVAGAVVRGLIPFSSGVCMSILNLTKIPAILVATALCVAAPQAAQAQGGVSLAPWAGVYIPTRNNVGDLDTALSRDVSVIGGARLTFWGTGI